MGRSRPPYPPEFKEEAIRLVWASDAEWPVPKVARDLGVSPETLRNWVFEELGAPVGDRRRRARGTHHRGERRAAEAAQRSKDPKGGARDLKKSGMVLRQGGEPTPQVIYAFIETEKANHRISRMCKTLKVSKSGFYSWRDRAPSARARADALLLEKIARIHADSRETYGAPRIHFELRVLGVRCARKRVARLMREAGLFGCGGRRRKVHTTLRSRIERTPLAPDLVKRNFAPEAPDRLWVADITYVRTWEGWLYLAFVLDTYSRKAVGWSMANNLRTGLVLDAVNMAIYTRRPQPGLIHHSDRGSQYTSVEFGRRLKEAGLLPSMGSVADAYDNSMAESFISTIKRELVYRHSWPSRQTARTAIFEYIEGFYNTRRRHSALGHLSPSEYEEVRLRGGVVVRGGVVA